MDGRGESSRWLSAAIGAAIAVGGSTSVALAGPDTGQPIGAYGAADTAPAVRRAEPVPTQPAQKLGPHATLGFAEADESQPVLINLPTALTLANASNPTIGLAQARMQEAYARWQQARVMWIPDLSGGPAYLRHDGLLQTSSGNVISTNKWNFFTGGQAQLAVDTSQALFGPLIARRLAQAETAAARTVQYQVQLDVANAYLDLLRAYAALAINREILSKTEGMWQRTLTADRAGLGKFTSDANRAKAAVDLRRQQRAVIETQIVAGAARLAQLLFIDPTADLHPADLTVLPIDLVPPDMPLRQMITTGLMNRPEMVQSRFLVGAASAQYRAARLSPLLPHLDVAYSSGLFGGGIDDSTIAWGGRGDATAQATWQLHNFGLGDLARVRAQRAVVNQANAHVFAIQAEIGQQVTTAAKSLRVIQRQLADDQDGVRQAEEMWTRLDLAEFGIVNVKIRRLEILEPLTAIDQLEQARTAYLNDVIAYNRSEFQLYWAMGQPPICALPEARARPIETPVQPTADQVKATVHPAGQGDLPAPRPAPGR